MKIFDCTTYFDEPLLFELRLNILSKYVDEFIVCEATFTHSGQKKKLILIKKTIQTLKTKLHTLLLTKNRMIY